MRIASTLLCFAVLVVPAAAETDVIPKIDAVTVYPDGATVTQRSSPIVISIVFSQPSLLV